MQDDNIDYKSMAIFFQNRIGEINKTNEVDLFFAKTQIESLTQEVNRLKKELETNVSEESNGVSATDE